VIYFLLKRLFDILCSALGLLILSLVFLIVAVLIKKEDGGPVFFRGIRVGRHGKPFRMYKFRTMVVDAEKLGASSTAADDARITGIGKLLRRCKLDELPQLINVFKGEMSFVGPRPQVQWAVDLYGEREKALLTVRPGMTDYASIKFRNEAEILKGSDDPDKAYLEKIAPEKIRLGLEYVNHMSFWRDLMIIFMTIKALFCKSEEKGV
jgi:lipopolysaccharide/colanic/teichoic acid biosynthesis glycosyltransferase